MTTPSDPRDGDMSPLWEPGSGPGASGAPPGPGGFDMGGLLSQALDMQRQMAEAQEALGHTDVVGESGGGLVRIALTGHFEVRSVHIDPSVVDPDEADLLADLVTAALRNAIDGVMDLQAERMSGGLPDLGGLLEDLGGLGGALGAAGLDDDEDHDDEDHDGEDDRR
jgi:DNA-binding YbaB/EbfC family protein